MNRRALLTSFAGVAVAGILTPELAQAVGQWSQAAASGIDWRLAFADLDADVAPAPMRLIAGRPPADLAGSLFRNGPGKFRRAGGSVDHWFDGDGLMRAFRIADGKARLAARFIDTPKRRADQAANAVVTQGFGTADRPGATASSSDDANAANISVMPVGGELWALWEAGSPTAIDPTDLSTKGMRTLRPDLAHMPFLAHPRAEPDGDIWSLGVAGRQAIVWRLGRDGALKSADVIALPRASYVHDFTATPRHLILILQPWIEGPSGDTYADRFSWRPADGTIILVLDKNDLSTRRVFEVPALFAFHYGAAWEEPDGTLRFDACASDNPDFATLGAREVLKGVFTPRASATLRLVSLSPGGAARIEPVGVVAEFPRADSRLAGSPRRYSVHATSDGGTPLFHGLATYDWKGARSDAFDFGPTHLMEEAVFVPRPGGAAELDGWLLAPSVNLTAKATELHVFDARRVAAGPLATWRADVALPVSLHGAFVSA